MGCGCVLACVGGGTHTCLCGQVDVFLCVHVVHLHVCVLHERLYALMSIFVWVCACAYLCVDVCNV